MTAPARTARLALTGHPLQRCGAWSVTVLARSERPNNHCEHPDEVSTDDLDSVARRLVDDVVRAATAAKDSESYDW